jgi:hypothetical protein
MTTPIQDNRVYRSRNGAIHKVLTIDIDPATTADIRPVATRLISGDPMTGRTFTDMGYEIYVPPGHPQPESPGDLVEDITDTCSP